MYYVELVIVLALLQYLLFALLAGRMRARGGVKAPAVSGHAGFERAYRVQMNTLELLIMLVPGLLVAERFWPTLWLGGLGAVYLAGRFLYCRAYMRDPARRGPGFALSILPVLAVLGLGLAGALGLGLVEGTGF